MVRKRSGGGAGGQKGESKITDVVKKSSKEKSSAKNKPGGGQQKQQIQQQQHSLAFVKERLEGHKLNLSMTNCTIITLPVKAMSDLSRLNQIAEIDLSCNNLITLPTEFCSEVNHLLRSLNLSNNQITTLPDNFGDLTKLEHLDLFKNNLTTLPLSFCRLKKLKWLDLQHNPLDPLLEKNKLNLTTDTQKCKTAATTAVRLMEMLSKKKEELDRKRKASKLKQERIKQQREEELKRQEAEKRRREKAALKEERRRLYLERKAKEEKEASEKETAMKKSNGTCKKKEKTKKSQRTFLKDGQVKRICSFLIYLLLYLLLCTAAFLIAIHLCSHYKIQPQCEVIQTNIYSLASTRGETKMETLYRFASSVQQFMMLHSQRYYEECLKLYEQFILRINKAWS